MLECTVSHKDSLGSKKRRVMLETNFPILQDFYRQKIVKDSDHIVVYDIKFGSLIKSTKRRIHIIEAGLPY